MSVGIVGVSEGRAFLVRAEGEAEGDGVGAESVRRSGRSEIDPAAVVVAILVHKIWADFLICKVVEISFVRRLFRQLLKVILKKRENRNFQNIAGQHDAEEENKARASNTPAFSNRPRESEQPDPDIVQSQEKRYAEPAKKQRQADEHEGKFNDPLFKPAGNYRHLLQPKPAQGRNVKPGMLPLGISNRNQDKTDEEN